MRTSISSLSLLLVTLLEVSRCFIRTSLTSETASMKKNKALLLSSSLEKKQQKASEIISTFDPCEPFNPPPLLSNCHLQTISAVFLRKYPSCCYNTFSLENNIYKEIMNEDNQGNTSPYDNPQQFYSERIRYETSDDDFFHVDLKYLKDFTNNDESESKSTRSKGLVVISHGFESNSYSHLVIDMARSYLMEGFDVAAINFRGCSVEDILVGDDDKGKVQRRNIPNNNLGGYHLGFTEDLEFFLSQISSDESFEGLPIYLSGFSLGANAILKFLGESSCHKIDKYNIQGAAVTSVPLEIVLSASILNTPGINKELYSRNLINSFKSKFISKYSGENKEKLPSSVYDKVMNAKFIYELEDSYLTNAYPQFKNHMDYYRKVQCKNFLNEISVPVLGINAQDDPFFHPEMSLEDNMDHIFMRFERNGGHCGFLFHQERDVGFSKNTTSWMPRELARFISHVHQSNL